MGDNDAASWEVENNLEAGWNCPECDYVRSGASVSPFAFRDHLMSEHDYSEDEAMSVVHG